MKNLFLLLTIISITSCSILRKTAGITIEQAGNRINITKTYTDLILSKSKFAFEFETFPYNLEANEKYNIKIAATSNKNNLKYFKEGEIGNNNPFLSPGTGLAGYRDKQYNYMFIGNAGHHSIFYKDDTFKRAKLIKIDKNGKLRLRWDINSFYINKKETKIEDFNNDFLYIMFFSDENLNNSVEKGEYNILTIKFE